MMNISRKGIGLIIGAAILFVLGILFKMGSAISFWDVFSYLNFYNSIVPELPEYDWYSQINFLQIIINQFYHQIINPPQQGQLAFTVLTIIALILLIVAVYYFYKER